MDCPIARIVGVGGIVARRDIYVDDNAPNDPRPYNAEEATLTRTARPQHPFDDIQKAIDAAVGRRHDHRGPGTLPLARSVGVRRTQLQRQEHPPGQFIAHGLQRGRRDGPLRRGDLRRHRNHRLPAAGLQDPEPRLTAASSATAPPRRSATASSAATAPAARPSSRTSAARSRNCLIVDNTTFSDCGVLPVVSGFTELVNCTIANNLSNFTVSSSTSIVRNCIIWGNEDPKTTGPP